MRKKFFVGIILVQMIISLVYIAKWSYIPVDHLLHGYRNSCWGRDHAKLYELIDECRQKIREDERIQLLTARNCFFVNYYLYPRKIFTSGRGVGVFEYPGSKKPVENEAEGAIDKGWIKDHSIDWVIAYYGPDKNNLVRKARR